MRGITASETTRPIEPRMNLETGRITIQEALGVGGLSLLSLFVSSLGGMISYASGPAPYESIEYIGGARFWLWFLGVGVGWVSLSLGVVSVWLMVRSWMRYEERLQDWHIVTLDAYEQSDGQAVERTITQWELTTTAPRDILLVALAVHEAVQGGNGNAHTVRSLSGAVWLGGMRLGDVASAERMSKALADCGLVTGKEARKAGAWVPQTTDEVISLVKANWAKVRNT